MTHTTAIPELEERDADRARLAGLVDDVLRGDGRVAVVEGAAGIGKSALARLAARDAAAQGLSVHAATGSELDREFPFGVVLQLLGPVIATADPARRTSLLAGAAGLAEAVLDPTAVTAPGADASFAALHGLYWLTANLAEEAPRLLLVDDLHWSDTASLRFLEFLGRRLEGLPVLVLATARPGEPGERGRLLTAVADGPAATVLRPAPLSPVATGRLVARRLGDGADPEVLAACHAATGGNPLLVTELARSLAERGVGGDGDVRAAVAAIGAADPAGRIARRLVGLGPGAEGLARAVAILGPRAGLRELAELAGLPHDGALVALDRLVGAEVLDAGSRSFVHPLVREATEAAIPPATRASLHGRAARLVASRGGGPAEVSVHLLAAEPAGDPWAAGMLREAARAAAAEGAADVAVAALRRALAEPPPARLRAEVTLELAEAEAAVGDPAALGRLGAVLAEGVSGDTAARAHAARARLLLLEDPGGAAEALSAALAEVREPRLGQRLESGFRTALFYGGGDTREPVGAAGATGGGEHGGPVADAHRAIEAAYRAEPAEIVVEHARRALGGDALLSAAGVLTGSYHLLTLALRQAEQPDLARAALDAGDDWCRRTGSRLGSLYMDHGRAYWAWTFGSPAAAEGHARAALAAAEEMGFSLARISLAAILAEILLARGDREGAAAALSGVRVTEVVERTIAGSDALAARAWVARAEGRAADAEADLRRARALLADRGWHAPHKARATLRLAELLAEREGGREEAIALADESREVAERAGLPGAAGIALRVRGRALRGEEAVATLRRAVAGLALSALRLDHAWALHDLGALLRRAGARREARDALRAALDLATRLGAGEPAAAAREELAASGARIRSEVLVGVAALTPSELRVAGLAARGLSNREIAESLWLSRKTVEVHLGRAYGKLGIRSRAGLAAALEEVLGAPVADGG